MYIAMMQASIGKKNVHSASNVYNLIMALTHICSSVLLTKTFYFSIQLMKYVTATILFMLLLLVIQLLAIKKCLLIAIVQPVSVNIHSESCSIISKTVSSVNRLL